MFLPKKALKKDSKVISVVRITMIKLVGEDYNDYTRHLVNLCEVTASSYHCNHCVIEKDLKRVKIIFRGYGFFKSLFLEEK